MSISINPVVTTVASGSFGVTSEGYVQGTALDDPAIRNELAGGVLKSDETLPMWGGVGIFEDVPAANVALGFGNVGRAANLAALTGFSVFNQAHAMVNSPQSPVPLASVGMSVNFFRLGSGMRIAVQCDPALASLEGGAVNAQVSWDFTNQKLIAYDGSNALPVKVLDVSVGNSMTVSYDAGTGFATWTRTGSTAIIQL